MLAPFGCRVLSHQWPPGQPPDTLAGAWLAARAVRGLRLRGHGVAGVVPERAHWEFGSLGELGRAREAGPRPDGCCRKGVSMPGGPVPLPRKEGRPSVRRSATPGERHRALSPHGLGGVCVHVHTQVPRATALVLMHRSRGAPPRRGCGRLSLLWPRGLRCRDPMLAAGCFLPHLESPRGVTHKCPPTG